MPLATAALAGIFSLLCFGGGSLLGRSLGRLVLGQRAPLIAGLFLLAVGAATLPGVHWV
jgi:putative Mn2+ efflux pump MntP